MAGCGGSTQPGTVPVSGTVKFDGQPLEGATISFLTAEEGRSTKTDKEGYYEFASSLKPLKYRVVVSKFEGVGGVTFDSEAGMDEGQLMAMGMSDPTGETAAAVAKQLIPANYSSQTNSELSFTVPEGGTQEANFELHKAP